MGKTVFRLSTLSEFVRHLFRVLAEYKVLGGLAAFACICEYLFFHLGWVNSWWLESFRYVWAQIPLHLFLLGLCVLLGRYGHILSFLFAEVYGLYIASILFLLIELQNTWTELWVFIIKETTWGEVYDFIICYKVFLSVSSLVILALSYLSFRHSWKCFLRHKEKATDNKKKFQILSGILLVLPLLLWEFSTLVRYRKTLEISCPRIIYALENVANGKIGLPLMVIQEEIQGLEATEDECLGVLVVGESATRSHLQCYGYPRMTTPLMSSHKDEYILYDNVWAPESYTQGALTYVLTSYEVYQQTASEGTLPPPILLTTVINSLKDNGAISFYSTQHLWSNDSVMYQMLKGASPAETGIKGKDYVLVNKLKDELEKQSSFPRKKLLIFQLYGSHFPYGGRCGEEAMKLFDSKDYSIRVNQYDASIYETDSLINQLRELLTQVSKPVWLLYLSDHGETPDSSINRNPKCRETWQIPFVFWFNDAFRTKHPVLVKNVDAARHTEFQSDVTFDIVCSLMGVSFKRFNSENLPFASNYKPRELHFPNGITKLALLQ